MQLVFINGDPVPAARKRPRRPKAYELGTRFTFKTKGGVVSSVIKKPKG